MKLVTFFLITLLFITLGAGGYFYLVIHKPMAEEHVRMKIGFPGLEKANAELKKYKEKEKKEYGWVATAAETLKIGLGDEIKENKAEVTNLGSMIVINISEQTLFTPGSVTFAKDSPPTLTKLASLLKSAVDIKDKDILIANVTQSVPTQGKGKRRTPPKEARTLAASRSVELVKYLERNGVPSSTLIAAAYPGQTPDRGFKIKDRKTVIVIANPAVAGPEAPAPKAETKTEVKPVAKPVAPTVAPQAQPKGIPIAPAPAPKKTN